MKYRNMEDRLLSRTVVIPEGEPNAGCWMWMGRVEPNGYAKIGVYEGGGRDNERVRNYWVHRVAYAVFNCCEIAEGDDIDHRCNFRICIHPQHLRSHLAAKNRSEGARRGNAARRAA